MGETTGRNEKRRREATPPGERSEGAVRQEIPSFAAMYFSMSTHRTE